MSYLELLRSSLRQVRAEHQDSTPEVWIQPNPDPGSDDTPMPLCCDIMCADVDGKPQMVCVTEGTGEMLEGPLVGRLKVGDCDAKVFPIIWDTCHVWFHDPQFDIASLDPWRAKWLNVNRTADPNDEDGLTCGAHYLSKPTPEGGGLLFEVDLGSAPTDALVELLTTIANAGATQIELGRSDGSDLDPKVVAELEGNDITQPRLTELVAQLLRAVPGVRQVQIVDAEQIAVSDKADGPADRQLYTANLYRRLQRVGREARVHEVWRFVRAHREGFEHDGAHDLDQLRPAIKDNEFFANPSVVKLNIPRRHLAGDLWVCPVWDMPNGMKFVTASEPAKYELSTKDFHARAIENFIKHRPEVEFAEHGPLFVARTGDCYDASLLLDDRFIDEATSKVRGDLLACVPSRDIVLICGSEPPENIETLQKVAAGIGDGGDHLITETVLRRRHDRWEVERLDQRVGVEFQMRTRGPEGQLHPQDVRAPARPVRKRPWWRFW